MWWLLIVLTFVVGYSAATEWSPQILPIDAEDFEKCVEPVYNAYEQSYWRFQWKGPAVTPRPTESAGGVLMKPYFWVVAEFSDLETFKKGFRDLPTETLVLVECDKYCNPDTMSWSVFHGILGLAKNHAVSFLGSKWLSSKKFGKTLRGYTVGPAIAGVIRPNIPIQSSKVSRANGGNCEVTLSTAEWTSHASFGKLTFEPRETPSTFRSSSSARNKKQQADNSLQANLSLNEYSKMFIEHGEKAAKESRVVSVMFTKNYSGYVVKGKKFIHFNEAIKQLEEWRMRQPKYKPSDEDVVDG